MPLPNQPLHSRRPHDYVRELVAHARETGGTVGFPA
jgi:hypothetical protein